MNLLCRLGIHQPEWQPSQTVQTRYGADAWLQVRRCARCGRTLDRRGYRLR